MFMQSPAEGALKWPIGIRRARPASGRDRPSLECQHTIDIIITILITATACCCNDSDFAPPLPLQFLLAILLLEANISSSSSSSSRRIGGEGSRRISGPSRYCGIAVLVVVITVCAAYAGRSLVAGQTTALCPFLRRTLAVLLAALPLLVLLATLTIAARCYASTASQPSPHQPYRNNHQHHNNHQNHRNTHPAPFATITNATATATSATTTTTASTNVLLRSIVQFSPQKLNINPNNINNHNNNNNNNRINGNNNINNNNLNSRNSPIIAIKYSNSQLHTSKILVLNRNDFPSPTRHARSGDTSGRSRSVIEAETKNRRVEGPRATAKAANTTRGRRKRRDFRSQFYNYNSLDTNDTALQHKYTVNFSSTSSSSSSTITTTTLSSNAISTATTTTTSPTSSSSSDSVARSGARNNHYRSNSSRSNSNRNTSSISGGVSSTFLVERKNDFNHLSSEAEEEQKEILRPMPPSHDHDNNTSFGDRLSNRFVFIVLLVILLSILLGLATYYFSLRGNRAAIPQDDHLPSTTPMLSVVSAGATAGVGGMDRLRGGGRSTPSKHMHPMEIRRNLPHSISLPDGENHPFNGRLQIRDAEQQSEILQKCIRPPPNRTVLESESPPSYRSGSGGSCNEWSLLSGTRSNSTSSSASSSKRPDTNIGASTSSSCSISPSDGCAAGGSSSSSGGGGQKTDFIQKTVKIFTGKKSQQQQQPPPAPAPTLLPQVLVPTARSRRPNPNEPHHQQQQQQQQHHHNNQQQQQQQNNGNAPRPHKPSV